MTTAAAGPDNASADPVPEPRAGFWRSVLTGVSSVLLVAVLALAVALAVVPRVMNGAALTVLTGSMEPTYSPGDTVVSVPQDRYDVGDVVTFQPVSDDPMLITHRVVAIPLGGPGGPRYVTRGDANEIGRASCRERGEVLGVDAAGPRGEGDDGVMGE